MLYILPTSYISYAGVHMVCLITSQAMAPRLLMLTYVMAMLSMGGLMLCLLNNYEHADVTVKTITMATHVRDHRKEEYRRHKLIRR